MEGGINYGGYSNFQNGGTGREEHEFDYLYFLELRFLKTE
jgi:hypothetical protein